MQLTGRMPDEYESLTPFQKVRHLLGVTESGIKDLGKNHRLHLIEKNKTVAPFAALR